MDFANGTNGPIAINPLINTVLYLNRTIESFGTGFGRVFSLCDKYGIETKYGNNDFGFFFEFIRKPYVPVNIPADLSETDNAVFEMIKNHERINRSRIAELTGKSEMTVQRAVNRLLKNNYIERIGSNKTGYWKAK